MFEGVGGPALFIARYGANHAEGVCAGEQEEGDGVTGDGDEIVEHGETGLIIQPRKPKEIADAVIALHSDTARRESMAKLARETAFREWSVEKWVTQFEEVYTGLMEESRKCCVGGPSL